MTSYLIELAVATLIAAFLFYMWGYFAFLTIVRLSGVDTFPIERGLTKNNVSDKFLNKFCLPAGLLAAILLQRLLEKYC
jgi:hypothetical protein